MTRERLDGKAESVTGRRSDPVVSETPLLRPPSYQQPTHLIAGKASPSALPCALFMLSPRSM
jgi:hypothetical protein